MVDIPSIHYSDEHSDANGPEKDRMSEKFVRKVYPNSFKPELLRKPSKSSKFDRTARSGIVCSFILDVLGKA